MTRLSPIHPNRELKPGRYMLDEAGVLWTPLVVLPFRMVAAVVVKAKPVTDDVRATTNTAHNSVESPVETQRITSPAADPLHQEFIPFRPMARRAQPTPVRVPADILKGGEDDAFLAKFDAALKVKRQQRANAAPMKSEPAIDAARAAAAHRARPRRATLEIKIPTTRALNREGCQRCGIPGFKGCAHQLPFGGSDAP